MLYPSLERILTPAYNPCQEFSGDCREMRWDPEAGHVPRGHGTPRGEGVPPLRSWSWEGEEQGQDALATSYAILLVVSYLIS